MFSSNNSGSTAANSSSSCHVSFFSPVTEGNSKFLKIMKLAEKKDPDAQVQLGLMFKQGQGTAKNLKEASKWFQRAAEETEAPAGQFAKGICHQEGYGGIEKDENTAVDYYTKAARQGYALAQAKLGDYYLRSILHTKLAPEDTTQDQNFLLNILNREIAIFKNTIGQICRSIWRISNEEKAFYWTQKAAEQGLAIAQTNLAYHYANGIGVKENQKEAFLWVKKAADQGDINGHFLAGVRYMEGNGTDADFDRAYRHLTAAANKDCQPAKDALTELEKKVVQAQQNKEAEMQPYHIKQT